MPGDQPPKLTDPEVVDIVRRVVCRSDFTDCDRCHEGYKEAGYDFDAVIDLLAGCTVADLHKHELDYDYPMRRDYIAVFKKHVPGERHPFYIKVALRLPRLERGRLISFRVG